MVISLILFIALIMISMFGVKMTYSFSGRNSAIIMSIVLLCILSFTFVQFAELDYPQILYGHMQIGQVWEYTPDNPFDKKWKILILDKKDGYVKFVYDIYFDDYKNNRNYEWKTMEEKYLVKLYKLKSDKLE